MRLGFLLAARHRYTVAVAETKSNGWCGGVHGGVHASFAGPHTSSQAITLCGGTGADQQQQVSLGLLADCSYMYAF